MKVQDTGLPDFKIVSYTTQMDERGAFARVFDRDTFLTHGMVAEYPQHSIAANRMRGTLRGLHYQRAPFCEAKVVRCLRGRVWDVVLDVRRASPTFGSWRAVELAANDGQLLYVGTGLAHGYVTLTDDAELHYLISAHYSAAHAAGVHWRDPHVAIDWPIEDVIVSDRDASLPPLDQAADPFCD